MKNGGCVRFLLSAGLLLGAASCAYEPPLAVWTPGPGQLTLSNYRFDHATIQAVATAAPDCAAADPGAAGASFDLPFKGTHAIPAPPDADICWRAQVRGGRWSDWNRAFTAAGRYVDTRL
jgi:hypothetical protein